MRNQVVGKGTPITIRIYLLLSFIALLLSACNVTGSPASQTHHPDIDKDFKEYYQILGEETILGPIISEVIYRDGGVKCQYTENSLMCFNPAATSADRLSLAPLANMFPIRKDIPEGSLSTDTGERVVDGYTIYDKFVPLYDKLYGARNTGRPLTNLRTNKDLNRVEQFFENVGFAQSLDDANGPVYLISYGAYFCGQNCSDHLNEYWAIVKANLADQPFGLSISRLGGFDIFGSALLQPRTASDGSLEQIYSTVMFYSPKDNASVVRLRPLPTMLGIGVGPQVREITNDRLIFYELRSGSGLGHNVLKDFDHFIAEHGGMDLSGKPISEVIKLKDQDMYRQCFENYCLLYNPKASEQLRVRLAPLGEEYIKRFPPDPADIIKNPFTPDNIFLTASVDRPMLNLGEEQRMRLIVIQKQNNQPLERVEGTLVFTLPDQTTKKYNFSPTDITGMSMMTIPTMSGLKYGDRVEYRICLNLPSDVPICYVGSYLIWNVK